MLPTDPRLFITDYEALRAAVLSSGASSATHLSRQRLIAEGLHAWLKRRALVRPGKVPRVPPPGSLPITPEGSDHEALVQLIASMTLGSLVFAEETA